MYPASIAGSAIPLEGRARAVPLPREAGISGWLVPVSIKKSVPCAGRAGLWPRWGSRQQLFIEPDEFRFDEQII